MNRHLIAVALSATLALAACSGPESEADVASTPKVSATTAGPVETTTTASPSAEGTPITISAGGETISAVLNDSQVARDFAATLPVTLPWYRNLNIEYITELDAPMTETGPFYTDVQPGDLVYYNPMDSITIIYEETSSVPTLTKMGEITSDLSAFRDLPDDVEMRVEAAS